MDDKETMFSHAAQAAAETFAACLSQSASSWQMDGTERGPSSKATGADARGGTGRGRRGGSSPSSAAISL